MIEVDKKLSLINPIGYLFHQNNSDNINYPSLIKTIHIKCFTKKSKPLQSKFDTYGKSITIFDSQHKLINFNIKNNRYVTIENSLKTICIAYINDDKQKLVAAMSNNDIYVYENSNWKCKQLIRGNQKQVINMQANHLRNNLLVLNKDYCQMFSLLTFQKQYFLTAKNGKFVNGIITFDAQHILLFLTNGRIQLYQIGSMKLKHFSQLKLRTQKVHLATSQHNKYIVIAGKFCGIYLCNNFDQLQFQLYQLSFSVIQMKFVKNILILLGNDQFIYYFDIDKNLIIRIFKSPENNSIVSFDIFLENKMAILCKTGQLYYFDFKQMSNQINNSVKSNFQYNVPIKIDQNLFFKQKLKTIKKKKPISQKSQIVTLKQNLKEQIINILNDNNKELNQQIFIKYYNQYKQLPCKQTAYPMLLKLPNNHQCNQILLQNKLTNQQQNAIKQKVDKLNFPNNKKFVIKNILHRLLSFCPECINHLDEILGLIFPLMQIFGTENQIFQFLITILMNWANGFFVQQLQFSQHLKLLLKLLSQLYLPKLSRHFIHNLKVRIQQYLISSLKILLTDLMNTQNWLKFMDFLIINKDRQIYFPLFALAYFSTIQQQLLKINDIEQAHIYILKQKPINFKYIMQTVQLWYQELPDDQFIQNFYKPFQSIPKGSFPLFDLYAGRVLTQDQKLERIKEQQLKNYQLRKKKMDSMKIQLMDLQNRYKQNKNNHLYNLKQIQFQQTDNNHKHQLQLLNLQKCHNQKRLQLNRLIQKNFHDNLCLNQQWMKNMKNIINQDFKKRKVILENKLYSKLQKQRIQDQQKAGLLRRIQVLRNSIQRQQLELRQLQNQSKNILLEGNIKLQQIKQDNNLKLQQHRLNLLYKNRKMLNSIVENSKKQTTKQIQNFVQNTKVQNEIKNRNKQIQSLKLKLYNQFLEKQCQNIQKQQYNALQGINKNRQGQMQKIFQQQKNIRKRQYTQLLANARMKSLEQIHQFQQNIRKIQAQKKRQQQIKKLLALKNQHRQQMIKEQRLLQLQLNEINKKGLQAKNQAFKKLQYQNQQNINQSQYSAFQLNDQ